MLLDTKDGISCDKCHRIYKNDFTYYSYDFYKQPGTSLTSSFDVCESCTEKITNTIIEINKTPPKKHQIRSDITGKVLTEHYMVIAHKVTVNKQSTSIDKNNFEFYSELDYVNEFKPQQSNWSTNV